MSHRLKPGYESFEIMSGPDEGKTYLRGKTYDKPPAGYEDRFESTIQAAPVSQPPKPQKKTAAAPVETPALGAEAEGRVSDQTDDSIQKV